MTTMDLNTAPLKGQMDKLFFKKRLMNFGIPAVILAYLTYVFFAFDVPGLWERASMDNARTLVSDTYSYKTHVTRDNRTGDVTYAVEGERKGEYPEGMSPEWVTPGTTTVIDLTGGHVVRFGPTQTQQCPCLRLTCLEGNTCPSKLTTKFNKFPVVGTFI